MKGSLILLVVLMALVALFTVQNPDVVTVRFFSYEGHTRMLAVIVASFAAGLLAGGLAAIPRYFRRRAQAGEARKRILELEAEVARLKTSTGGTTPKADTKPGPGTPGGTG